MKLELRDLVANLELGGLVANLDLSGKLTILLQESRLHVWHTGTCEQTGFDLDPERD